MDEKNETEPVEDDTVEGVEGDEVQGHSMAISANFSIDLAPPKPGDVRLPGTQPTTDPTTPPTRP
jgi:hypothetical protein